MAFDLGLVEDAYTAALSNPQHDAAEDKIRRLVLALVEQGEGSCQAQMQVYCVLGQEVPLASLRAGLSW